MDRKLQFEEMSTFDLVFNIATKKYNETDIFLALDVIKSRDTKQRLIKKSSKPPLKGSKAEKILKLLQEEKTPVEIADILKKKHKITAYPAEIYRIKNRYLVN